MIALGPSLPMRAPPRKFVGQQGERRHVEVDLCPQPPVVRLDKPAVIAQAGVVDENRRVNACVVDRVPK